MSRKVNDFHIKKTSSLTQQIAYAAPVLSVAFLLGPLTILQGIYAKYFGLSLGVIATVLLVCRIFDAVLDPIIGYLSDRYYARSGSRKPFVVVGGVSFIIASYFLFVPPEGVSASYFLGWFLAFYLGYTLFEIPHLAWGGELASSSSEKNTVYGWRSLSWFLGALLFFAMPLLPIFESNAFTPQTLRWSALTAGCLMLPLLYLCVRQVPCIGDINDSKKGATAYPEESALNRLRVSILKNPPLLYFLAALLFSGIGTGMWFTLVFIFVESHLGLGENFALTYTTCFGISILTLGIWSKLANLLSKQIVWSLSLSMLAVGILGSSLLPPGEASQNSLLLYMTVIYSGFAAQSIMVFSLLSDIIDYSKWKFGGDQAASFFSLYTLMSKTNVALGGAAGLALVEWYGFDASSRVQDAEAVLGLNLAMVWVPVPMLLISLIFISLIPINARRHRIVRNRLDISIARLEGIQRNYSEKHIPSSIKGTLERV